MFEYADPVGRDFLASPAVAAAFRAKMQGVYEQFARRPQSAFTWLEAFQNLAGGQAPQTSSVVWLAFPLLAAATDAEIDRDRFRWQDEYVEWRAETANGVVTRVTFTTEFPEYFEAFAQAGTAFLVDAVKDAIPGATPTVAELFGPRRGSGRPASGGPGQQVSEPPPRQPLEQWSARNPVPDPAVQHPRGALQLGH
jgi:hypothetical protein